MTTIRGEDITETIRAALQFIAVYHAPDYITRLAEAYRHEQSAAARDAIGQILQSARMAALVPGHRHGDGVRAAWPVGDDHG